MKISTFHISNMRITLKNSIKPMINKIIFDQQLQKNKVDHRGNNSNVPLKRGKNTICLTTTICTELWNKLCSLI